MEKTEHLMDYAYAHSKLIMRYKMKGWMWETGKRGNLKRENVSK